MVSLSFFMMMRVMRIMIEREINFKQYSTKCIDISLTNLTNISSFGFPAGWVGLSLPISFQIICILMKCDIDDFEDDADDSDFGDDVNCR